MSWFKRILPKIGSNHKKGVPEGLWHKCPACMAVLYRAELSRNLFVCSKCDHHIRLTVSQRIESFLDPKERVEIAQDVQVVDRLKFRDSKRYRDRISAAVKKTEAKEALQVYIGKLQGTPLVISCFDFSFIGGSMSAGVGQRFIQGVEAAIEKRCPFICFTASGGARMQEGLFSLMQMARTSAVLGQLSDAGLPYIVVLTDPTMGGVSASLATLGDIIIAEPKALIGFSGPRVIEQTIGQVLPEGFQRSEFLIEHGIIDAVVDRRKLRSHIARLLDKLTGKKLTPDPVTSTSADSSGKSIAGYKEGDLSDLADA